MDAVARAGARSCAGNTLVVVTAGLVLVVMMVVMMVVVMTVVVAVIVAVVMMTMMMVMLLLATALRLALVTALVVVMMVAVMMMTMMVVMVLLLLLAVAITRHATVVIIMMVVMMMVGHITLLLGHRLGLSLRDAKSVTSLQVAGVVQPRVGHLEILDSGVVDCSNGLTVVTSLNNVLCLGCKATMTAGLGSAGGINSHRLDRGLGHRTVLGVSLGVVNALGHRPGTDHSCRAHSCLDKRGRVWNLYCAGFRDRDTLLAGFCDCWLRFLVTTLATLAMAQLEGGITQAGCLFLICCISCCNVSDGGGWRCVAPVEEAFSVGQSQTGTQEKQG